MVSDFVEEVGRLLEFDGNKVCLKQMATSPMICQVQIFFGGKYPTAQGLFIFDHAPSHTKKPEDALNADRINISEVANSLS